MTQNTTLPDLSPVAVAALRDAVRLYEADRCTRLTKALGSEPFMLGSDMAVMEERFILKYEQAVSLRQQVNAIPLTEVNAGWDDGWGGIEDDLGPESSHYCDSDCEYRIADRITNLENAFTG